MHIAIRADSGPEIGFGHLIRVRRVSEELLGRGHDVTVVTDNPAPARNNLQDAVEITTNTTTFYQETPHDLLIVDLPAESNSSEVDCLDTDLMQFFDERAQNLVIFEDFQDRTVCCDGVVNGHVYADAKRYDWIGTEPDWLMGGDYVIFDKQMREMANQSSLWREKPQRAVITMGGSDVLNLTPTVMRAFTNWDVSVDVIIGPGTPDIQRAEIRNTAASHEMTFFLHEDPENFAELLYEADFAVTVLGLTTYELFAMQTPVIGIKAAPDQEPKLEFFRQNDVGLVANSQSRAAFENHIATMMEEPKTRKAYRQKGAELVDPDGILKIVDYIETFAS